MGWAGPKRQQILRFLVHRGVLCKEPSHAESKTSQAINWQFGIVAGLCDLLNRNILLFLMWDKYFVPIGIGFVSQELLLQITRVSFGKSTQVTFYHGTLYFCLLWRFLESDAPDTFTELRWFEGTWRVLVTLLRLRHRFVRVREMAVLALLFLECPLRTCGLLPVVLHRNISITSSASSVCISDSYSSRVTIFYQTAALP